MASRRPAVPKTPAAGRRQDDHRSSSGGAVRPPSEAGGRLASAGRAVSAALGALMGLLPHLMHHVGLIAGAALVTGVVGNLLFGAVGLLLSVPLLRRLYRHFRTWKAPAAALVIFAGVFALSALVIGPALVNDDPGTPEPVPSPTADPSHAEHHGR